MNNFQLSNTQAWVRNSTPPLYSAFCTNQPCSTKKIVHYTDDVITRISNLVETTFAWNSIRQISLKCCHCQDNRVVISSATFCSRDVNRHLCLDGSFWHILCTLQWRHNESDGVSIHRRLVYWNFCSGAENIKTPCHWPLWGEFTGDRWIPGTN